MSGLLFHPKQGDVLICDFDTGFVPPEMVKRRPVAVISRSATHGRGLCAVVPFSTAEPIPMHAWHHEVTHVQIKGWSRPGVRSWAKADMIATVGFARLAKPHHKTRHGRVYQHIRLDPADLAAIQEGLRRFLGM